MEKINFYKIQAFLNAGEVAAVLYIVREDGNILEDALIVSKTEETMNKLISIPRL